MQNQEAIVTGEAVTTTAEGLTKQKEQQKYNQGLQDYVAGKRETVEARYYVDYWGQRAAVGEVAVQALAE